MKGDKGMCNFCNGTHVVKDVGGPLAYFLTCPVCGPKPKEQREAERKLLLKKLSEAKQKFGMGDTAV